MAATDKVLRESNKRLLLQNTNKALKAASKIIDNEQSQQRVGAIQSALKAGLAPPKQTFPTIALDIDLKAKPLDKAAEVIDLVLNGRISADHGNVIVSSMLQLEQLRHDVRFTQRFAELQQFIGSDKIELINEISQLRQELAQAKGH